MLTFPSDQPWRIQLVVSTPTTETNPREAFRALGVSYPSIFSMGFGVQGHVVKKSESKIVSLFLRFWNEHTNKKHGLKKKQHLLYKVGPSPVINGVITPASRVIAPVTHL